MPNKEGLYPQVVEFSDVYHSGTQGPDEPVQAVIRDQEQLRKLLPDILVPPVDFKEKQVIVVALGRRPTDGYDVRITSVMYITDRLQGRPPLTMIGYTDSEKGGLSDMVSKPIHIVSTRPLDGEIEFEAHVEAGRCSNWKAWIDAMPPGRRLHVKGRCVYPTPGWSVTLEKSTPEGINPGVLVLQRKSAPPRDKAGPKTTVYEPAYDQKLNDDENYYTVTITPDNVSVKIEVVH